MSRSSLKLVLLVLCLLFVGEAFGQDKPQGNNWNGQSPSQAPPGFVAAHTFYWMLGIGTTIVGSLSSVIGILWIKLGKKEEDERKDVLVQITGTSQAAKAIADQLLAMRADWAEEKKDLKDQLSRKEERLEKQHDKTLQIAVRAQQAVEAMANLPMGENILDKE